MLDKVGLVIIIWIWKNINDTFVKFAYNDKCFIYDKQIKLHKNIIIGNLGVVDV